MGNWLELVERDQVSSPVESQNLLQEMLAAGVDCAVHSDELALHEWLGFRASSWKLAAPRKSLKA